MSEFGRQIAKGTGFALVLLAIAATASAQQVPPPCTEDTRECMIQAATAYLDSIVAHDAAKLVRVQ